MKGNIVKIWQARRNNHKRWAWTQKGYSYYPTMMDGFPTRPPIPASGAQRYRYVQVNAFRLELRFRMRSREEDGMFWERRLA